MNQDFGDNNQPLKLVTNKPDIEIAEELKLELAKAAEPWLTACTKARSLGFEVNAQFTPNAFKQTVIASLQLVKVF